MDCQPEQPKTRCLCVLFNSVEFLFFFLPITLFFYFWLSKKRLTQASKAWLVFASLFFYSWWNIIYLPLILGSILFNFAVGSTISKRDDTASSLKKRLSRKSLLVFGVVSNILLLGYFKYMDFFIANTNTVLGTDMGLLHIILPLGISFFTFTQIAYLVDAYRNEVKEMDYLNYTLFVTFFPHLLAGPILHHKEMMPQFDSLKSKVVNYKNILMGLFLFSVGLFKKVIIADTFAQWATTGFDKASALNFFEAWATSLSYTFQLYFDFSGYTDMAIGLALLFNIKLPINFNSPYKATDIQDFWRRWHMTLSRFLRDYIYIPLGGNRKGEFRTYNNLMVTFLLGGIWHGAGWTFVFWGFLHGAALVIHRMWHSMGFRLWKWVAWFVTFNFVNVTWVFFRAEEWKDAIDILSSMFSLNNIVLPEVLASDLHFLSQYGVEFGGFTKHIHAGGEIVVWLFIGFVLTLFFKNSMQQIKYPHLLELKNIGILKLTVYSLIFLGSLVAMTLQTYTEFIYFNF